MSLAGTDQGYLKEGGGGEGAKETFSEKRGKQTIAHVYYHGYVCIQIYRVSRKKLMPFQFHYTATL